MTDEALDAVLRLVADGRLTAEEARPILDALDDRSTSDQRPHHHPAAASARPPAGGAGRALRIEVTEAGRKVVNLRVPLALGQSALQRVPGLSDAAAMRIREAIESGLTGPVVVVDEPSGDGVRIVLE
ncbi:MAG TPA: hypothetical protein VIB02_01390 [Candidatus Limnocylindrales bacterium]|jgi:hypothetical protein